MEAGAGTTTIGYDQAAAAAGRTTPDGSGTVYRWDVFDRLERIERHGDDGAVIGSVPVAYDALDRPSSSTAARSATTRSAGWRTTTRGCPGGERPLGGTAVGDVWVVGARVLDPDTHQFLSTDPLLPVPGSHGAASGYTYCWNDPVNWADPTGMRPLSIEEFAAVMSAAEQTALGQAWEAIKEDPWGTLAMVGVTAVGVGLCATGVGTAVGAGILIGVGASAGIGLATGTFNPRMVAVNGVVGGLSAGVGGALTTTSWQGAVALGTASGAGETIVGSVLAGQGFPSTTELLVGAGTGGLVSGGANAFRHLETPGATAVLDHTPSDVGMSTRGLRPAPGTRVRPEGLPESWRITGTRSPGGVRYFDPQNPGNAVRVMQGNPNSPYPASTAPYVRWQQDGHALDVLGNKLPTSRHPDAHIPLEDFTFVPEVFT